MEVAVPVAAGEEVLDPAPAGHGRNVTKDTPMRLPELPLPEQQALPLPGIGSEVV